MNSAVSRSRNIYVHIYKTSSKEFYLLKLFKAGITNPSRGLHGDPWVAAITHLSLSMTSGKITQSLANEIDIIASRAEGQGSFRAVEIQSGAFVKLEDTRASTAAFCAMDCIKTPACFTFRFMNGFCSLGSYNWL